VIGYNGQPLSNLKSWAHHINPATDSRTKAILSIENQTKYVVL